MENYLKSFRALVRKRIKILRIMKLTIIFLLVGMLQVSANVYSQNGRISVEANEMEFSDLLWQLQEESGIVFVYKTKDLKEVGKVSIRKEDASMAEILDEVLNETNLEYTLKDDVVIIKKVKARTPVVQEKEDKKVTGKVTDENGVPLPGVSVLIKGSYVGTSTDFDGMFTISVQKGQVLVFSMVGMESKEVAVDDNNTITIKMLQETATLEDVVVTGIFTRKAESFTGTAKTIKSEELQKVANGNLFESLKNLDPSLNIMDNMEFGSDPNKLPRMQLRGTSTFPTEGNIDLKSNFQDDPNQPLFVLDGFETSATAVMDMDMERIASVTILKDAAAKAIYGSKAANGVIVIETRKPLNGTLRLTYKGSLDISAPDLSSYNLCDAKQKLEAEQLSGFYEDDNQSQLIEKQQLYNSRLRNTLEGNSTYWLSKPLQTSIGSKHSLALEFGSDKIKMITNLSYQDKKGIMKESARENIAGSMSMQYRYKKFIFKNNFSIVSNKSIDSPYGSFYEYARMNPYWDAYDADGNIATSDEYVNPLHNAEINTKINSEYLEFTNNFYTEWSASEFLKVTSRIGITTKTTEAHQFLPSNHTAFVDYEKEDELRKGSYQLNNGKSNNLSADLNLRYTKNFGKHFIMSNLGVFISQRESNEVINYAEGFPSDKITDISFALQYAESKTPFSYESINRELGFLGVFGYTFDDRFLSDFTVRYNASSQYGSNKRWGAFWSLGLGWNIHKEKFFKGVDWIKLLKLKGSIGTSGSQNVNTFDAVSTYGYYTSIPYNGRLGAYMKRLANEDLQWQQKLDKNFGFEANMGRLAINFSYYVSDTENLITNLPTVTSIGYSSVVENIGKVRNKGIDCSLSYQLIKSKSGFLNLNFAVTSNDNEIIELSEAMKTYNNAQDALAGSGRHGKPVLRYTEGGSMNTIWAVKSLGIDPATGREIYLKKDGTKTFEWDSEDQIAAGNSLPKYRGNFGLNGEFNGFGLSVTARFLTGGEMYNQTLVDKIESIDMNWNVDERVLTGRWKEPGQLTRYKTLVRAWDGVKQEYFIPATKPSTRFVQSRSELDISSVSVYYDFKKSFSRKLGLERLKISAYMNDVHKFSSVKVERGLQYPFARSFSFAIKATL